jgi:hypothetical protein
MHSFTHNLLPLSFIICGKQIEIITLRANFAMPTNYTFSLVYLKFLSDSPFFNFPLFGNSKQRKYVILLLMHLGL